MFSVIPAIDILAGECVRLVRGDYGKVSVFERDPAVAAARFADAGFRRLHIVDLDAARGTGNNVEAVQKILQETKGKMRVQLGGGLRKYRLAKCRRCRCGFYDNRHRRRRQSSMALCYPQYPGKILLALDMRGEE